MEIAASRANEAKESTEVVAVDPAYKARAVIYLRVSTAQQAKTDRDAEGYSIPAQREACHRRAASLGAVVVDEYVDAGESARSSDRPALQSLLQRLQTERDVDIVVVHKVDRLARNRADDVAINLAIRQAGAQLVSVSENIDQTPSGMLLHGIMSSIAEFYSQNLAAEIVKGMNQKAKKGGLPGRAPIGYLNVREVVEGHEIRTIDLDPERADHVRWAFEAYGTGDYTLARLTEELEQRGLTTRPTARWVARPLTVRYVNDMLRNPVYAGMVVWSGVQYVGRHEPLVTVEVFSRVQAVLSEHRNGEKQRVNSHYLKSTIFCGRCGNRLAYTKVRGRGGEYAYFRCGGRATKQQTCDLPHLWVSSVEELVEEHYATIQLSEQMLGTIGVRLKHQLQQWAEVSQQDSRRHRRTVERLEGERRKLLHAYQEGAIGLDLLKEEQERLTTDLGKAQAGLAASQQHWEDIERGADAALALLANCQEAYRQAKPAVRKQFNQALFEAIFIDFDDGERLSGSQLAQPFSHLLAEDLVGDLEAGMRANEKAHAGHAVGQGLPRGDLVEVRGFEPLASAMRPRRSSS